MDIQAFNQYLRSFDKFLTDFISSNLPFASSHLTTTTSAYLTKLLVVIFVLIIAYETVFYLGHKLNLWEDDSKKIFVYKPVHCAHVYVKVYHLNSELIDKVSSINNDEQLIKSLKDAASSTKPIKYHFEFGPDDYDYTRDKELGCTIRFLINKLNTVLNNKNNAYLIKNNQIKNKDQCLDDALCLQGIETGNTVDYYLLN